MCAVRARQRSTTFISISRILNAYVIFQWTAAYRTIAVCVCVCENYINIIYMCYYLLIIYKGKGSEETLINLLYSKIPLGGFQ